MKPLADTAFSHFKNDLLKASEKFRGPPAAGPASCTCAQRQGFKLECLATRIAARHGN